MHVASEGLHLLRRMSQVVSARCNSPGKSRLRRVPTKVDPQARKNKGLNGWRLRNLIGYFGLASRVRRRTAKGA